MSAFYAQLPQYQYQNGQLDFTPLNDGINALGQRWEKDRKLGQFDKALAQAGSMPGVRPEMIELARTQGPDHGPNALFQVYAQQRQNEIAQQQRTMAERQFDETVRMHDQTLALQQQQEKRIASMTPYEIGIKKAQAENSKIDTDMMRGLMPPRMQGQSGQIPPPGPPPSDPNTIPGQAPPLPPMRGPSGAAMPTPPPMQGQGVAQPAPMPMPPLAGPGQDWREPQPSQASPPQAKMIQTPFGVMPLDEAHRVSGLLALRGKHDAAKLMKEAIDNADTSKEYHKAFEKERGDATAKAVQDLPTVAQAHKQITRSIDDLLNDPALSWSTGPVMGRTATYGPGATRVDEKFMQIKSQAFMSGAQTMRGLGALTEAEGAKVTSAVARLNQAKSTSDIVVALKELKQIADDGMQVARQKAGMAGPASQQAKPRLRYDPATGEIN